MSDDGMEDLIMGSPMIGRYATHDRFAGAVHVLYGRRAFDTWPSEFNLMAMNGLDGEIGFTVQGKDRYDLAGFRVEVADMNADGKSDLILTSRGGDGFNNTHDAGTAEGYLFQGDDTGEIYVLFGGSFSSPFSSQMSGWPSHIDLQTHVLDGSNGFVIYGENKGDRLGRSLAVGDINGDGIPDIAMGAHTADGIAQTTTNAGEVHVLFGTRAGFQAVYNLETTPLTGSNGFSIYGKDTSDTFGFSVDVGDINNDGFADLVVGAREGEVYQTNAGEVYVFYGKPVFPASTDLKVTTLDGADGFVVHGRDSHDMLGVAVRVGDANNDGVGDLMLGAFRAKNDDNNSPRTGESYVLFGSPVSQSLCGAGKYNVYHGRVPTRPPRCQTCLKGHFCPGAGHKIPCPPNSGSPLGSSSRSQCVCNSDATQIGNKCMQCHRCASDEYVSVPCSAGNLWNTCSECTEVHEQRAGGEFCAHTDVQVCRKTQHSQIESHPNA